MNVPDSRIAVLGGGPIGLETALYARTLGFPVTVYEAQAVGHHPSTWGHVRLFTPWALNVSWLGERRLRETGAWTIDPEALPTGRDLVRDYLRPLAGLPELAGTVREGIRVAALSRGDLLKGDGVTDGSRRGRPFTLLLASQEGETLAEADLVIDATGVYGQPNALGRGGIPAPGERALGDRLETGLPDVAGRDRERYAGKRVLVVGNGLSAATSVVALAGLPETAVVWVTRGAGPPVAAIQDDTLPSRVALTRAANDLAAGSGDRVRHLARSSVTGFRVEAGEVRAILLTPSGQETVAADRVLAQTGFRPDNGLYRELQVHECYASQGPMKLAAALLGAAGGDCMTQSGFGPDSLVHPEPGFFIVGHKSYGRNPAFLLRTGREQIRDVFRLVSGDAGLDLYSGTVSGQFPAEAARV